MVDQHVKCFRVVCVELEPKRDAEDLIAKAFQILRTQDEPDEPLAASVSIEQDEPSQSEQEVQA